MPVIKSSVLLGEAQSDLILTKSHHLIWRIKGDLQRDKILTNRAQWLNNNPFFKNTALRRKLHASSECTG